VFYGQFLTPSHYFWGSDAQIEYVPARTYFYDKIVNEHSFPFWTEKLYSGFPIYADLENAYLNPINDASILIFGPQLSYKILHVLEYLIGSLSLFFLMKRKGIGLLGFAAANAIFYFNTFSIDHQIHFNIIMAFYLIPTAFLLADLFIEKRRLSYLFLESLVVANAVLWGHMQSAIIVFMGIFAYMAVFSFKKMKLKTFIFYFAVLILLIGVETFPQILPSYNFFSASSREADLNYLKGSLTPQMAIFSFVPYLLGNNVHFMGKKIDKGFTYTEIYTYLGISSVLLSGLALLLLKKSRDIILAYIFIWIFLIFSFMDYNKMFPPSTPLITLFRDWERTVALSSFGVALLVGIFVEKIKEVSVKNLRTGFFFVASPLAYLWLLNKANENNSLIKRVAKLTTFEHIRAYQYFPVLSGIVLSLLVILIAFFVVKKMAPNIFTKILLPMKIILVGIVFFDLIYFSKDVLAFRLQDISKYKITPIPAELANKRTVLGSVKVTGMESLYYNTWSPFGYSQFKEDAYEKYFNRLGLGDIKISSDKVPKENFQPLKDAGIVAIARAEGINFLNDNKLDVLKNNLDGDYVKKSEGKIIMHINNPADTVVSTYLKYDPNWRVKVDGQQTQITKNGIFFDFPLSQGSHLVEIYYYPKPFFVAVIFSLISGIIIGLLLYILRKKIRKRILE
jgi:hypothetical protein